LPVDCNQEIAAQVFSVICVLWLTRRQVGRWAGRLAAWYCWRYRESAGRMQLENGAVNVGQYRVSAKSNNLDHAQFFATGVKYHFLQTL